MSRTFVIDCFPESAARYLDDHVIVVVDVFRFTTTATTALDQGRRVVPVASTDEAAVRIVELERPLLVGEIGGNMPYGWDLHNSPARLAARDDVERPVVLLSSSGSRLMCACRGGAAVFAGCLRNFSAVAARVAALDRDVALLGAGTRGVFRREDQMGCAWIAQGLLAQGYEAGSEATRECVARWAGASPEDVRRGRSAAYLRDSGQSDDIEFVLAHVDDLDLVPRLEGGELVP